ncbi:YdcH family protein [Thiolinea disciformis]|uniref:YdcH family protein n=1 Tax=Thiolinea disciformis TaxID=125614 RepID=UPI0003737427|nr:YdcH family protein [Thiolinea disciformis]
MFGESHDLVHEFPEHRERIHELKINDHHFAHLFEQYNEVEHHIHRIEQGIETPEDAYVETLKKQRLHLKDELLAIINRH